MMRLPIYRKDMELVVFRGFNLINREDPILMRFPIYRKDDVSDLCVITKVVFRGSDLINHKDPIHDVLCDLSWYFVVFWLFKLVLFELHLYIRSTNSGGRIGYVPSL